MKSNMQKVCYKFKLETASPLSIGGAYNYETDHDIILHSDNEAFIPSSSIAGCLFAKENPALFGINNLENSGNAMDAENSRLFISDGIFINTPVLDTRDGIKLNDEKQTENSAKFDNQIIQNGQAWTYYIEFDAYNSELEELDMTVANVATKLNSGIYRLGYKQNRGYGMQAVKSIYKYTFNKDNYKEYLDFYGDIKEDKNTLFDYTSIAKLKDTDITLSVTLKLQGPLGIKSYSTIKSIADSSQIRGYSKNDSLADIPGTSINGALRAGIRRLARDLGIKDIDNMIEETKYVIDEGYYEGSFMNKTRNKIDDFSASTIDSALFKEEIFIPNKNSSFNLNVRFKKYNTKKIIALAYLALQDFASGYQTIGGGANVGYGEFEYASDQKVNVTNITIEELVKSLNESEDK